ncbi:MAG: hypothetical protein M1816_008218 [Peltula sp. TS41687]|nr:MAG: hypothetical protein M1816_008218 [Peltula sp. TS41687]
MAFVQETLTWIAYAITVCLLMCIASIFVYTYQRPGDRSAIVSIVSIVTLTSLLATVLLLPVDLALVSSTTSRLGRKKDWATPERVHRTVLTLQIVYYTLYSLDALLCLVVIPFTYFWYEEYDEVEALEGDQSLGKRLWGAFKYTTVFILLVVILFLIGFFIPVAKNREGRHFDRDYFRRLLTENREIDSCGLLRDTRQANRFSEGERSLTFAIGLLSTLGTILYVLYTAPGLALSPISLIKSAPGISAPDLAATTASALGANRERQRQLDARNLGRADGLNTKDRRELDSLIREERTLVRRERLAAEAQGEGHNSLMKVWAKIQAIFRPVKLFGGILLLLIAILIWVSMLLTAIDKVKNSICKTHCGYILGRINIFNPINWILIQSAKVFPVDYILVALLVLFFLGSSIVGIASIGIRFLWVRIFQIRKGHTSPQALLMTTVMLTLISLATDYALVTTVAPQYAIYGRQRFCTRPPTHPEDQPDCSEHPELIRPCSERSESPTAGKICTPSVVSTFLNRITVNFPFYGVMLFWAQFAFLGEKSSSTRIKAEADTSLPKAVFLIVFLTAFIRTPKLDETQLDDDAEEQEEESLLASTSRRFGATWQDITGRGSAGRGQSAGINRGYGTDEERR